LRDPLAKRPNYGPAEVYHPFAMQQSKARGIWKMMQVKQSNRDEVVRAEALRRKE
jgi:hypothetical protein